MLAQLLSSKPKTQIINLLLAHPSRSFSLTELRASTNCSTALLKQTIKELAKMDFLSFVQKNRVRYYQVNRHFPLYPELINLLRKAKSMPPDLLSEMAARLGDCKLVLLTGVFTGRPRIETDLLFVGKPKGAKLNRLLRLAEKFAEQEINYTIFSTSEFEYRQIMNDRFLKNIMENSPLIVIDKTRGKKR